MTCPICRTSPPPEARYCWTCGAPQPEQGSRSGELRQATVLCYRISGAESAGDVPDGLREAVEDALLDAGGRIMGSAGADPRGGLGVFVEEGPGRDAARQATRAAIQARSETGAVGRRGDVAVHFGAATGVLLLEEPAEGGDQLVGGLPIGVARRLAGAAGPREILVDEATRGAVDSRIPLAERAALDDDASPVRVPVWAVDGEAVLGTTSPRPILRDRTSRPVVGRDAELARAQGWFDEAVERGRLCRLVVAGPPGSGRTRFVRALVDTLRSAAPSLRVAEAILRGRDVPTEPFHLLVRLVRSSLRLDGGEEPAAARRVLEARLDDLRDEEPGLGEPFVRSRLRQLAGVAIPEEQLPLDPEHASESAHAAVARLLRALAARHPLVVLIEDAGDASHAQHRALARLAVALRDRPALFLSTAGEPPGEDEGWTSMPDHDRVLELSPLPVDVGRVLVDRILGRRDALAPEVADRILEHTGGLPLFVEEALSALVDAGLLVQDGGSGSWHLEGGALPTGFPTTLRTLLAARLDQMPAREAALLRVAAVAGERAWRGLIADMGEPQAELHIRRLEERGLLRPDFEARLPDQVGFRFAHRATRETVRADVHPEEARRLHVRVARWLAVHAGDAFHGWLSIIAWHFDEAGERAHATSYHLQAARWARDLGDLGQALDQFERARRSAPNRDAAMECALELAEVYLLCGRWEEARGQIRDARAWAEERQDLRSVLTARVLEARNAKAAGDHAAVDRAADDGVRLARDLGAGEEEAALLIERARAAHARGREEDALEAITRAVSLAEDVGDRLGVAVARSHRGRVLLHLGRLDEARDTLSATADEAAALQHELLHARAVDGLAWVALVSGETAEARRRFRTGAEIFDRLRLHRPAVPANLGLALVALEEERYTDAANEAAGALERAEASESPLHVALGRVIVGHVYGVVEVGKHRLKARALGEAALRYAKIDRIRHLEEGLLGLETHDGAPRLFHGLAALFLAEYLHGTESDPPRARGVAERAAGLLSGFTETPIHGRCKALLPTPAPRREPVPSS